VVSTVHIGFKWASALKISALKDPARPAAARRIHMSRLEVEVYCMKLEFSSCDLYPSSNPVIN